MSAEVTHQQQQLITETVDALGGTNQRPVTSDTNAGSSGGTSRNNSPPRPFTTEDPSTVKNIHPITIYDSSRDEATAHLRAAGRIGDAAGNTTQQQRPNSTGHSASHSTNNVYSALDELRFEILDANSQAIYLTQCQDYVTAEQLLVTTFNRLVELEEQQVQQLEQLEKEQEALAEEGDALAQRRADIESDIHRGGADPAVEGGAASQQAQQLQQVQMQEVELGNRRYHLEQIADQHRYATQLNDLLKATTLNNIAFVIYHRGMFREALTHLETAQSLEGRYGIQSPAVAINLCVLQNAVQNYDLATQYALLAIDMLRRTSSASSPTSSPKTAAAKKQEEQADQHDGWRGQDPQEATGLAPTTFEEKKKLWGAAWHNLAVAQLQLADPKSEQQNSNVRLMFENSISATIELLGREHPMSRAVVESYRIVRKALHERGAYKPQRQLVTGSEKGVPMLHTYFSEEALQTQQASAGPRYSAYTGKRIAAPSHRGNAIRESKQLSVLLHTKEHIKYVEKIDSDPYTQQSPNETSSPSYGSPTTSRALTTAGSNGMLVSPRVAQQQRNTAMVREQALSSRKLSRGTPSAPTNTNTSLPPLSNSARGHSSSGRGGAAPLTTILSRHHQPPSVNSKGFFVGSNNAPLSAGARKNQMAQRALGGSMLQGNLALAVALYSNPHPLSSTITAPPAAPGSRSGAAPNNSNQYYYNAAFGGLSTTPGNSPRAPASGSKLPPQRLPTLTTSQQAIHAPPQQQTSSTSSHPGTSFVPAPPPPQQQGGNNGPRPPSSQQPFNRSSRGSHRPSQQQQPAMAGMLIGDMWVEAPIAPPRAPFRTNSPHTTNKELAVDDSKPPSPPQGSAGSPPNSVRGRASVVLSSPGSPSANSGGKSATSPSSPYNSPPYPQQLLAPDPSQRVVDPSRFAHPAGATPTSDTNDILSATNEKERELVDEQRRRSAVGYVEPEL